MIPAESRAPVDAPAGRGLSLRRDGPGPSPDAMIAIAAVVEECNQGPAPPSLSRRPRCGRPAFTCPAGKLYTPSRNIHALLLVLPYLSILNLPPAPSTVHPSLCLRICCHARAAYLESDLPPSLLTPVQLASATPSRIPCCQPFHRRWSCLCGAPGPRCDTLIPKCMLLYMAAPPPLTPILIHHVPTRRNPMPHAEPEKMGEPAVNGGKSQHSHFLDVSVPAPRLDGVTTAD